MENLNLYYLEKPEDHYGVIHEDHSKATTHRHKTDDSAYAVFTEPRNGKKHWLGLQ